MKPRHLESKHAQALMRWVTAMVAQHPEIGLLYHIPNGGRRGKVEAAIMKAEGVKRGMPDYHLPVARQGFIGLWVELKAPGGRTSKDQRERIDELRSVGHRCEVAEGWEAAAAILMDYLTQPEATDASE